MSHAQSVNFNIEVGSLYFEDGTIAGRDSGLTVDHRDEINVFGAVTSDIASFTTSMTEFLSTYDSGNGDLNAALASLSATLGSLNSTEISIPSTGIPFIDNAYDFYSTEELSASSGDSVLLIVTTASSLSSIGEGDQIGIATASGFTVMDLGTYTIGFQAGSGVLDSALLGTLGASGLSMATLGSNVPEPSFYAAAAGALALAFVAIRRRRRA